jgi:hypothetical protein
VTDPVRCHDCGVLPGERHVPGCDVARCKECGEQMLQCGLHGSLLLEESPMTVWTGEWPGDVEVREGLAVDLNELSMKGATGQLRWDRDRERWVAP